MVNDPELVDSKHLIFRITEYAMEHSWVTLPRMQADLELTTFQMKYVKRVLVQLESTTTNNPNHILVLLIKTLDENKHLNPEQYQYTLVPQALYNYVDYMEIIQARKAAEQAREQSSTAIQISIWALIAAIVFGVIEIFLPALMKH